MERLTIDEIIEHYDRKTEMYEKVCDIKYLETTMNNSTKGYWEHKQVAEYLRKLKEYEDLEEQGRLINLPCKVGDTVHGMSMGEIIRLTVNEISIFCMKGERVINVKCQNNDEFRNYVEREFGKTVFLTKSEAEEKLKELRGGDG